MSNTPFTPTAGRNTKKIILIAIGSLILVGLIGYGTVALLKQLKAPTIADGKQTQSQTTTPAIPSAEEALAIANKAKAAAVEKVNAGNQEDALKDYQTAYDNYKIAGNEIEIANTRFAIESIEAVIAVPENPRKPGGATVGAKE